MTTFPLCVFLDSCEQGRLPFNHPFYRLVEEALRNIIQCPLVMRYMARNTLGLGYYEPFPDEVVGQQRVSEIIQYLQNVCPTVSGSDSSAMDSTFVVMRAYSGCPSRVPRRRSSKVVRKHVYIQKRLVDTWMRLQSLRGSYYSKSSYRDKFFLLTFFMKVCLLRGLTAAVKLAFTSESNSGINGKDHSDAVHDCLELAPACSSSFEHFLSQWSNGWLVFETDRSLRKPNANLPYNKLHSIVFTSGTRHVELKGNPGPGGYLSQDALTLQQLAAGDWTAFPPVSLTPYNVFHPQCLRMWKSPPADDAKPRGIERGPCGPSRSDRGFFRDGSTLSKWKVTALSRALEE